jgi:hypothetical protein
MNKLFFLVLALLTSLTACVEFDESTLITDDNGYVHRTLHYLRDKRGRNHFPKKLDNIGERQFIFDPKASAWAAYNEEGKLVMTGSASGGKDDCDGTGASCRTVTGTFRIYNKRGLDCRSGEYPVETKGGTKMPYCMYFYRGYVRVLPSAAKWLNEEFMRIGTKVTVLAYPDEAGI